MTNTTVTLVVGLMTVEIDRLGSLTTALEGKLSADQIQQIEEVRENLIEQFQNLLCLESSWRKQA